MNSAPASSELTRCTSCGELDYTGETKRCLWGDSPGSLRCLANICSGCFRASEYGYCAEHEAEAHAISDAEGN